jgi:hypothetical protein
MSNRYRIALLVGLAAVAAVGFVAADKPAPAKDPAAHDFGTKVLLLSVRTTGPDKSNARVLEQCTTRQLCGRWFVVGLTPDLGPEYTDYKGTTVWVPVDEVIQINEFDNLDVVKKMYANQQRQKGE